MFKLTQISILFIVFMFVLTTNGYAISRSDYKVNCDDVENVISAYYPSLKIGNTIEKKYLIDLLETRKVNYKKEIPGKFYKMNYEDRSSDFVWLRPRKKEKNKCTLIFSMPKKNKATYWGVDVIRKDDEKKPYIPLGKDKKDYGAILAIVENDLSITPYMLKY